MALRLSHCQGAQTALAFFNAAVFAAGAGLGEGGQGGGQEAKQQRWHGKGER